MEVGSLDNGNGKRSNVVVDHEKVNEEDDKIGEPKFGMAFDSVDEMSEFYKNYGKQMGFPVRRRSSSKGNDGVVRYVTIVCSRAGKSRSVASTNPFKPSPSTRTECKAKITACLGQDGKFRLSSVILDHNHALSPGKAEFFHCYREKSKSAKKRKKSEKPGLNENIVLLEKDYRSTTEKARRLQLGEGDAFALQNYLLKMQVQTAGFFFNMDLDEEGRLKNVFWADGRSREAYKEFGEVVTFDTTYLANKYDMPLVTFVGVNHHGQSTLLGCGLISSEDTYTFSWLFRTWLACMSGCAPHGIITDQDAPIQKAVQNVFPNTRHRWCLWNVMKRLPEKLSSSNNYESISFDMQGVVYDSQNPAEFEQSWSAMVDIHGLHDNEWLSGLYNERHRWVPCFVKTSFWAGMSSTQRIESMPAFFDAHVNSKTTLKQFVEQYDNILRNKVEKEFQSDFKSFSQLVPCATFYEMEKQVQAAYTISKFKEFQEELTGKMYCEFTSIREDGAVSEYHLREDVIVGEGKKRMIFMVSFNREEGEVKCSCHMFEFRGILCRHALNVLIRNDTLLIPQKYILWRWRKNLRRCYTRVKISYDVVSTTPEQLRYDTMCNAFTKVADLAAEDEGSYTGAMQWIDNSRKELLVKRQIPTR